MGVWPGENLQKQSLGQDSEAVNDLHSSHPTQYPIQQPKLSSTSLTQPLVKPAFAATNSSIIHLF